MNRLKELREERGWSTKDAAEKIGLPYTTYRNYEVEARQLNSELLILFADFYGVTIVPSSETAQKQKAAKTRKSSFPNSCGLWSKVY